MVETESDAVLAGSLLDARGSCASYVGGCGGTESSLLLSEIAAVMALSKQRRTYVGIGAGRCKANKMTSAIYDKCLKTSFLAMKYLRCSSWKYARHRQEACVQK
jgi:hypothetical protein